jgi:predicted RNA-binding protein YlxR (DUF448 family)
MVRVIRAADGTVEVDTTGKKSGRGAYLCLRAECWEAGLKKGRLAHSLKATISSADAEALKAFAQRLGTAEVSA